MGDINQTAYLKNWLPTVDGPILEVGSKEYGSTSTFRKMYPGQEYVGLDMAPGEGVDVVADLTQSVGSLPENHFPLAICVSVLEHVAKPWLFAANLTRLVRPGGKVYMSVPWVWRYHAYPDDYFRFSHRGIMSLFEEFEWSNLYYSTSAQFEFAAIDEKEHGADNRLSLTARSKDGGERKYLPYLMVNMLGTKRS
jgi:SAM-dependent methyltransferase